MIDLGWITPLPRFHVHSFIARSITFLFLFPRTPNKEAIDDVRSEKLPFAESETGRRR